jgi:hypothetical protein
MLYITYAWKMVEHARPRAGLIAQCGFGEPKVNCMVYKNLAL